MSMRLPRPLWILLATVVLVVVAAGLRIELPLYWRQAAVREIERLSGQISYERTGPDWLRNLIGEERMSAFDGIEYVRFPPDEPTYHSRFSGYYSGRVPWTTGPTVSDAALSCLAGVPDLKQLDLEWTNVSDAGMIHVARLHHLEELLLEGTDVSDCRPLSQLRNLKTLDLAHTKLTETGLEELKSLTKLEVLFLDSKQLTAAGVRHLKHLPALKAVHIRDWFDSGNRDVVIEAFKRELPGVKLH
jgi:hypothetical protein